MQSTEQPSLTGQPWVRGCHLLPSQHSPVSVGRATVPFFTDGDPEAMGGWAWPQGTARGWWSCLHLASASEDWQTWQGGNPRQQEAMVIPTLRNSCSALEASSCFDDLRKPVTACPGPLSSQPGSWHPRGPAPGGPRLGPTLLLAHGAGPTFQPK